MKRYLTAVLILGSFLLIFESCSSVRRQGYRKEKIINYEFKPVFGSDFNKSLYNVKITFGKKTFTSLAVIKRIPERKSFKLALLTEAGMRLFEIEFSDNGTSKVNYTSDFMNKKAIVKKLSSDFGLLFPGDSLKIKKMYSKPDSVNYAIRINENSSKDYCFSSGTPGPVEIIDRSCSFGRTTVFLNKYGDANPQEILFTHKMLKFEISLKQINYTGWN